MRRVHRGCLIATTILTTALAEAADDDPRARAQQLFDTALEQAERGAFDAACPLFLASQTADPKTSTLLNLASCYEKQGKTASAWGAFREAEVMARRVGRRDWEARAKERAEALEAGLLQLTVAVPAAHRIKGLIVERDGVALSAAEWDLPVAVDPGEHSIEAHAPAHAAWSTRVTLVEGRSTTVVPRLAALPEARPDAEPAPTPTSPARAAGFWTTGRVVGVALGGAGLASLVAGGVLGLVAKGQQDDALALCQQRNPRACPDEALAKSDDARGLARVSTAVVVGGVILTGVGVGLTILARPARASSSTGMNGVGMTLGAGSVSLRGVF